jgi:rubredoxin
MCDPGDVPGTDAHDLPDLLDVTCPRCGTAAQERFYGPCSSCRGELRATLGGEQREVAAATYEPKMNVTPNAVASKD